MMRKFVGGRFNGPVLPADARLESRFSVMASPDIASLPFTPDLVILRTQRQPCNRQVTGRALARKGVKRALSFLPHVAT